MNHLKEFTEYGQNRPYGGTSPADLGTPTDGKREVTGIISQPVTHTVISKIQVGDYRSAKDELESILRYGDPNSEDVQSIIMEIEAYLQTLDDTKKQEIINAINIYDLTMEKINKYKEFTQKINEQQIPTDLKTIEFSSLVSMFETLVAKKSTDPNDEKNLNNLRAEILGRYARTGAKP